jgi:general secretion pathway protein I
VKIQIMIKSHPSGFTLLETLVAFTILALSLSVLLVLFSDLLDHSGRAAEESAATSLATSTIDRIGTELPLADGIQSGDSDRYHWQLAIRPYGTDEDQANHPVAAHSVTGVVDWHGGGRHNSITLNTIRLGPPAS